MHNSLKQLQAVYNEATQAGISTPGTLLLKEVEAYSILDRMGTFRSIALLKDLVDVKLRQPC